MGVIGFFVWLGGACFQQVSGVILASFPEVAGHPPVAAYRVVFGICLVSVGMSIVLAALSHERRSVVSFSVDHVEAGKGVRPTIMSRTRRPS
jgi:ABC-type enterobactin transport system permease subunit